jgi:hypothetical protein
MIKGLYKGYRDEKVTVFTVDGRYYYKFDLSFETLSGCFRITHNNGKTTTTKFYEYDISTLDSVEEFFRLCQGDELSIELEFVKSKYASFELTGNFIASYIEMADDDFRSELQSKMRNKILKKYGRRKPKTEEETDESTKEEKVNDTLKESNDVVDDKEE